MCLQKPFVSSGYHGPIFNFRTVEWRSSFGMGRLFARLSNTRNQSCLSDGPCSSGITRWIPRKQKLLYRLRFWHWRSYSRGMMNMSKRILNMLPFNLLISTSCTTINNNFIFSRILLPSLVRPATHLRVQPILPIMPFVTTQLGFMSLTKICVAFVSRCHLVYKNKSHHIK